MIMKAAAIILSGGKSSRMGTNKAFLKINEKTNIERIRDRLKPHFDDIILVTNNSEDYRFLGISMTGDQYPGMGPLAGVHAGLIASDYEVNVIVACDMPFVSGELAELLASKLGSYDAVIPVINGKQHPLFAVFRKGMTGTIENCIKEENLRMKHLLDLVNVHYVTEKDLTDFNNLEHIFFNMNNPEEYQDALRQEEDHQERK
jgi:molybdopterin-guanine dinucleotide biosynthesis protein A